MRPFAATEIVVFDAYGTLFDFASAARRVADELGGRGQALTELWRAKQIECTWHRSLTGHHADFQLVTGEALDYALAALGIRAPGLRERLMALYLALDPFPDARSTLETLKRAGKRIAILSNGSPAMLAALVAAADFGGLLDAVISVERAGIFKPHPASYRLACTEFGVDPQAIAFVSANGWDCCGASVFGFRCVKVQRSVAPPEPLPGAAEHVVASLTDILPIMEVL
jgi:2-haloacid dehalogenase